MDWIRTALFWVTLTCPQVVLSPTQVRLSSPPEPPMTTACGQAAAPSHRMLQLPAPQ